MECPACGRYAPPDPDTGYDADDICGECSRDGFTIDAEGHVVKDEPREKFPKPESDEEPESTECPF